MSDTKNTIQNKLIYGLFIFIFCAEWMFLLFLNPIYYHFHNGVEVAATVIESNPLLDEIRVSYPYGGQTYECVLDSQDKSNTYTPEQNAVIDIMINSEAPNEVISNPTIAIATIINPVQAAIFICLISLIPFYYLNGQKCKVENSDIVVDKEYITACLMKYELLWIVLNSAVTIFSIFLMIGTRSFLFLQILFFLMGACLVVKSVFHVIKMIRDDQYVTVKKALFKSWKYEPGAGEDYAQYEIKTTKGKFNASAKFSKMNENDCVLIVSYAGRQNPRMLLGLTKNVSCKITSDKYKNDEGKSKTGSIFLYGIVFLAATFCIESIVDNYQQNHPMFPYVQNVDHLQTTGISDAQKPSSSIVDYTKKELTVDITTRGEVAQTAVDINSKTITVNNKTYTLPVKYSDLIADGWSLPEGYTFANKFQPNTVSNLLGFFLQDGNGARLFIGQAYNPTDEITGLENCLIGSLGFNSMEYDNINTANKETVDFILPGGITANSTAADVIEIFGNPEHAEQFDFASCDEDSLDYHRNLVSDVSFYFSFEPNGTIKSFSMTNYTLSVGPKTPFISFYETK